VNTKATLDIATEENEFLFVTITGKGVDNFEEDGKLYKAVQKIDKKDAKVFRQKVLEFWQANKDAEMPEEPKNFKNITWENANGDTCISAETAVSFTDKDTDEVTPVRVGLVDGDLNKLDPDEFKIGKGSVGSVSIRLKCYESGKGKNLSGGVSMFLTAIQLIEYVPYSGGDGTSAFSKKEGATPLKDTGGFKKKDKKVKVEEADEEEAEAPKEKKKKKDKKKKNKTEE